MVVYTHLVLVCVVPRACRLFSSVYVMEFKTQRHLSAAWRAYGPQREGKHVTVILVYLESS